LFWDKDVALAQRLEAAGLPVFNSAAAIATCDDKIKTALALARQGVAMPRTIFAPKTFEGVGYASLDFLHTAVDTLGLPLVIKEACGSFGQQVYLAQTRTEAEDIVRRIGHKDFLMQEFVASSRGTDLRVNVVGGEVVAAMRRFSATDFRSNVTLGGGMERATPTPAQCEIAVAACRAVGADFAGVDILYGPNDAPLVCEVNSNPHFRSTLDCTGVNLADVLAAHVLRAIAP
jgi:RimK family alpha-L-glutamate ligase